MPTLALNKTAKHHYEILKTLEAGIVLSGAEVKSVKLGQINLKGSYISLDNNMEAWLVGAHISPYKPASGHQHGYIPTHKRKLILHKKELSALYGKTKEAGLTIVPLSVYTKGSLIKVEVGVGRGKKKWDKRESIKKRDVEREIKTKMKSGIYHTRG